MRAVGISYLFLGAGHPSCPESGRCCQPLWKVLETFASYLFVAEKKNKPDFFFSTTLWALSSATAQLPPHQERPYLLNTYFYQHRIDIQLHFSPQFNNF